MIFEARTPKILDFGVARFLSCRCNSNNFLEPRFGTVCLIALDMGCGFCGRQLAERQIGLTDRWSEGYFRRDSTTLHVTLLPNTIVEFE